LLSLPLTTTQGLGPSMVNCVRRANLRGSKSVKSRQRLSEPPTPITTSRRQTPCTNFQQRNPPGEHTHHRTRSKCLGYCTAPRPNICAGHTQDQDRRSCAAKGGESGPPLHDAPPHIELVAKILPSTSVRWLSRSKDLRLRAWRVSSTPRPPSQSNKGGSTDMALFQVRQEFASPSLFCNSPASRCAPRSRSPVLGGGGTPQLCGGRCNVAPHYSFPSTCVGRRQWERAEKFCCDRSNLKNFGDEFKVWG
jgi:hypothetical protein